MDKIIFLDIDGVLNVIPQGRDRFGAIFHKEFVENLQWIIDNTQAKIVISSTWRMSGLEGMKEMWHTRNLPGEVIGITPKIFNEIRGVEIDAYLQEHPCENYVIIDDNEDMLENQYDNFVKTSDNYDHIDCIDFGYGLTRKCSERAIEILNKP